MRKMGAKAAALAEAAAHLESRTPVGATPDIEWVYDGACWRNTSGPETIAATWPEEFTVWLRDGSAHSRHSSMRAAQDEVRRSRMTPEEVSLATWEIEERIVRCEDCGHVKGARYSHPSIAKSYSTRAECEEALIDKAEADERRDRREWHRLSGKFGACP